ncbi:putative H/ACA ribonucleoprotein complex subunit 1-like protein 1 [Zea mays]|uniref:H/ACA ribonucleoprotein complex subunit n=1 Tax=Zea mays TaxID=4577 RepID=A0A3L6F002_MAIZE|nr:putative H/ACA ribonucleoprotein complex subunit 1-like protein 1 [Zea mays]
MRPPRGRGGGGRFGGGGGRGRGGGRFSGGGRGGGGGRFGGGFRDEGPPAEVVEVSTFLHACEGEAVTKLTNEKVPYFNAPIYLQNKTQIGKVEEIFGPINESYFSVKMMEGIIATSYNEGDKFYIDPMKLLPLSRFLPQPKVVIILSLCVMDHKFGGSSKEIGDNLKEHLEVVGVVEEGVLGEAVVVVLSAVEEDHQGGVVEVQGVEAVAVLEGEEDMFKVAEHFICGTWILN